MKIALVIDWLTEVGGAERVLRAIHQIYPDAPIYTSQYRPRRISWFNDAKVKCGCLNLFPAGLRKFMAPLRLLYFNHLKLNGFDVIISICNSEAKAVRYDSGTRHVAYLQGPPTQYYWGMYNSYIANPGFGKFNWLARIGLQLLVRPMRWADLIISRRPSQLVANSTYVQDEIKRYYRRDSVVLHPPVAVEKLLQLTVEPTNPFGDRKFFVVAGRQVNWKRFDLAIKACIKASCALLLIGDGAEHDNLVKLANGNPLIKFLPKYNGASEIAGYFKAAEGFIFCSKEPFGITPVEALASGCPIIGLNVGGSLDIVQPGVNGALFDRQTVTSLATALQKFNRLDYSSKAVANSAKRFSEAEFAKQLRSIIEGNA